MDRIAAARERLEAGKAVAFQAFEAGPPCSECRYKTLLGMCGNPVYAEMRFDPAKGVLSEVFKVDIAEARSENGICGPEAILFENLPVPVVAGKALVKSGWLAIQAAGLGAAALLVIARLLL